MTETFDLSAMNASQLVLLYQTARAAADIWSGYCSQPRAHTQGEPEACMDFMIKEYERGDKIREAVAYELRRRPSTEFDVKGVTSVDVAAIYMDWASQEFEDAEAFAQEAVRLLTAAHRKQELSAPRAMA